MVFRIFKKILLITSSLLILFFTTFIVPQKQADAIGFLGVLPAGITIGAGTYVVGALGLSAVVGIAVGDEYGDEINVHAREVWASSTQLSKDSLNWSLNQAAGFGNGVVSLGYEFTSWMDSVGLPEIDQLLYEKLAVNDYGGYKSSLNGFGCSLSNPCQLNVLHSSYDAMFRIDGVDHKSFSINVQTHEEAQYRYLNIGNFYSARPEKAVTDAVLSMLRNYENVSTAKVSAILSMAGINAQVVHLDGTAYVDETIYNNASTKLRENWESMKDAGLVLPVDSATAYKGDIVMDKLNTDGTYTGIDGNIYNPGDLTWSFPKAKIGTGVEGLTDGVHVDSPALTGNPVIDNAILNNPSIPKTTTNITTGETVTTGGGTPINPPVENTPGKINFKPLVLVGGLLLTQFPFSIPWDVFRLFGQLDVDPITPVFKFDNKKFIELGDMKIPINFKFNVDFTVFDPIAKIARWGLILAFDIALIMALRRLTPD